jgi:hypothetical protein
MVAKFYTALITPSVLLFLCSTNPRHQTEVTVYKEGDGNRDFC